MSRNSGFLEEGISRRSFLKKSLGVGVVLLAAGSAGGLIFSVAGCTKSPATADLTAASSVDLGHSHNITIPGADIDSPPSEKSYTSDGPTHQHAITLKKADFEAIKKGQDVTIVSTYGSTSPSLETQA
jgi:hypothetical protein